METEPVATPLLPRYSQSLFLAQDLLQQMEKVAGETTALAILSSKVTAWFLLAYDEGKPLSKYSVWRVARHSLVCK
jgi:hypothetical protein